MEQPVFRFAPSANGRLHLGHAYSALLNEKMARESGGKLLLRIEDLDRTRCRQNLVQGVIDDLDWLGIEWHEEPLLQSTHSAELEGHLTKLTEDGLTYRAILSRKEIRDRVKHWERDGATWPKDPDGSPIYPGDERDNLQTEHDLSDQPDRPFALRLNLAKATAKVSRLVSWQEEGEGPGGEKGNVIADARMWGDFLLKSKDGFVAYHLACVVDDCLQGVTHVVRGQDLFWATAAQRMLQQLLGLPAPRYHHHQLITDQNGKKLSKSDRDTSLADLRQKGAMPGDIRRLVFSQPEVNL